MNTSLASTTADVDISEQLLAAEMPEVMERLLLDRTTGHNIIWATAGYEHRGKGYAWGDEITVDTLTRGDGLVVVPRCRKAVTEQARRVKDRAEVFTPSWVCNRQNNIIDEAWFGRRDVFNREFPDHTWLTTSSPVAMPLGRTWRDYIDERRLEMTCGEAPYLASRHDSVTGQPIAVADRIGLLDRKLRVVAEHCATPRSFRRYALRALRSVYGFEWQGDSLLLAREALLFSYIEHYRRAFAAPPHRRSLLAAADIISWNLWQMDGLHSVVPGTCRRSDSHGCQRCPHAAPALAFANDGNENDDNTAESNAASDRCLPCRLRLWGKLRRDDTTTLFRQ